MKRGARRCGQCSVLTYPSRRQAEEAARRKGCPVTAVYRCAGSWHFDADAYQLKEQP